ncbi:MAG: hypothetical protein AAF600_02200 [Bacteroidota bacterium]
MHLSLLLLIAIFIFACDIKPISENAFSETPTDESEFVAYDNPPAEDFDLEGSDMLAVLLADKCMLAMGGREAWDNTRYISWNFFGRRDHLWDKHTGEVRIEDPVDNITVLMNINNKTGKVFKNGVQIADSTEHFLEKGYGWWVNDSYWLVMPFKLKDSGVTLKYLGEDSTHAGSPADLLKLTFDEVGLTPQNMYEVWLDTDSKLVTQWAYYPDNSTTEPRFVMPWADYKKHGEIFLSGNRGDYSLNNIKVLTEVPSDIFNNYEIPISSIRN